MTMKLDEFMKDFTPEERARVAARTAELVDEESTLRETTAGRDRRVILAGDLADEEVALIARAELPAEHAQLDDELKDWRP